MKNLICPTDTGCPALFLQMCVSVCLNDGTVMCETIKRPNKCVIRESLKCIRATETWKEWEKKREDTINQFDRWVNSGNNVKGKEKRRQQQRRWRQRKYHSVIKKSEKLHFGYFIQANTFFWLSYSSFDIFAAVLLYWNSKKRTNITRIILCQKHKKITE